MAVGSGACVLVAGGGEVTVNAAAVSVNCETTVLAAEVRTAATSGVGSRGCCVADPPQAPISSAMSIVVTTSFSFIVCHPVRLVTSF